MKETVFFNLQFAGSANPVKASANISVPFKVKTINVKSACFQVPTGFGATDYVVLKSNIDSNNSPLAILFRDSTYASATVNDVEIQLRNPEIIQGTYDFFLYDMRDILQPTTNSGQDNYVTLVLEFDSPDEIIL
jgi:hypothetical protein